MALQQPLHDDVANELPTSRTNNDEGQGANTAARLAGRIRSFSEDKARSLREGLANLKRRISGAASGGRGADGLCVSRTPCQLVAPGALDATDVL